MGIPAQDRTFGLPALRADGGDFSAEAAVKAMEIASFDTDLAAAQGEFLNPLLPRPAQTGRPPTCCRRVRNAILYGLQTGCQWRSLPHEFPPRSTVQGCFRKWSGTGTLEASHHRRRPTTASLFVRTAVVTPADVPAREGGKQLLDQARGTFPWRRKVGLDGGFSGADFARYARSVRPKLEVEVVARDPAVKGFQVLARRWVVARTFGWLVPCRRRARDHERLPPNCRRLDPPRHAASQAAPIGVIPRIPRVSDRL